MMLASKERNYKLFLGLCIFGIVQSIWEPLAISKITRLERAAGEINSWQIQNNAELKAATDSLQQKWDALRPLAGIFPDVEFRLGRSLLLSSLAEESSEKKVALLCQSLRSLQLAAQKSPHNPLFQIAWADLEGHLPMTEVTCEQQKVDLAMSRPRLSPRERLEWARRLAPYSVTDLYFASLAYLGLGEKNTALKLLRLNAEINPYFTADQRGYVFQLVSSADDLQAALPRRYPEIIPWLDHFKAHRPEDLAAWQSIFETAVTDSIKELESRVNEGKLSRGQYETFIKTLAGRPLSQQADSLRQRFDGMLSGIYRREGETQLASLLSKRRSLQRIPVLKATIADDTSPRESMLYNWVSDANAQPISLDKIGRSIGFFVPADSHLSLIVIESESGGSKLQTGEIEVLLSADNMRFFKDKQAKVENLKRDGRDVLAIWTDGRDADFVKLHYTGPSQRAVFKNGLDQLIQVYGGKADS